MDQNRIRKIRIASWVGIIGNGILAALKVSVGLLSGSMAVVADGIDSASDIVTSLVTLFTADIIAAPPDREHPWGHSRAETIATKLLSFIIFFAGAQLAVSTVGNLLQRAPRELPGRIALAVTGVSIAGKIFLALHKYRIGRETDSSMLKADAMNMRNDIFLSLAVLTGLTAVFLLKQPVIDTVTGLLLSLWIMKSGFDLFMETSLELMDSVEDHSVYRTVFDAADRTPGVINPHRARIRKLNNLYDIDLDIEVEGTISVMEAHRIAQNVEQNIKKAVQNIFDIMVHVEPEGNVEQDEQFGLTREDL